MCFKIALELQQIDAWTDFQRQRVPEFSRGYRKWSWTISGKFVNNGNQTMAINWS